jgi:hypothetical protein
MDSLEDIRNGIANGNFTIDEVNEAVCDGIKRHYGVENLYFTYKYLGFDGYGSLSGFNDLLCSLVCSTTKNITDNNLNSHNLNMVLKNLSKGKEKIYFSDLGKNYNNLNDLRHDLLVINLSGI